MAVLYWKPHYNEVCYNEVNCTYIEIFSFNIQVGNAALATKLSNDLMQKHNIYVQAINYPTVPMGQERLRIAPTPHHTQRMMDDFVECLVDVWKANKLELHVDMCPKSCEFCQKPLEFEKFFQRTPVCERSNCTYSSLQSVLASA